MLAWLVQRRKSSYPDRRDSKVGYGVHLGMLHKLSINVFTQQIIEHLLHTSHRPKGQGTVTTRQKWPLSSSCSLSGGERQPMGT